jgi:hypothetical protein
MATLQPMGPPSRITWITTNLWNDIRDCSVATGDKWA